MKTFKQENLSKIREMLNYAFVDKDSMHIQTEQEAKDLLLIETEK